MNLSSVQLATDDILDDVRAALRASGLPPDQLTLEILESSFDYAEGVIARLAAIRRLGVRLSIDDFGTALASLSSVADATVTELKVDRSLVAAQSDPRMLAAVSRLGQTLGLHVVAEGVETQREWERVRDLGYDAAQGYYASRPVCAAEVTSLLLSWPGRVMLAVRRLAVPTPAPTAA